VLAGRRSPRARRWKRRSPPPALPPRADRHAGGRRRGADGRRTLWSLTTLVNNAAATHLSGLPDRGDTGVAELANEVLDEALATNLWGLVWCCKHAIAEMTAAGGGSIINISSGVATKGAARMDAYTATKGAMNALTRSMAVGYGVAASG
jgi:NAD(P)-dependent dehydrogenase (short-subunit alcohol dehydrogenase family)